MRLAMIMPTYTVRPALEGMAAKNALLWKRHCDDLIICEDAGKESDILKDIADLYIYRPENIGVCNNMRLAWLDALDRGADYVLIADSDVTLTSDNARLLCVPGKVTVPYVSSQEHSNFTAPILCVPRTVSDEWGIYDEAIGLSGRDDGFDAAYYMIIRGLVEKIHAVTCDHIGGATRSNRVQ